MVYNMRVKILTVILFLGLCVPGFSQIQYQPEKENIGLLATVNGIPITIIDVLEHTANEESRLSAMYKGQDFRSEVEKVRKTALETVIDRKLAYENFKTFDFKLPRDFVENNLDQLLKSFNVGTRQELEKLLSTYGSNLNEFKDKAYESAAVDSLLYEKCCRDAYVAPKDVFAYYETHKNEFIMPAEYNLSVLSLKREGVHKADLEPLTEHLIKALSDNQVKSFEDAVSLYSDGPSVDKNGNIGWIDVRTLKKDLAEALKLPQTNHVYGPVKTKEAYYFIRVNDIKPSIIQPFSQVSSDITEKLLSEQRDENYKKFMAKLRSEAYIVYYVKND